MYTCICATEIRSTLPIPYAISSIRCGMEKTFFECFCSRLWLISSDMFNRKLLRLELRITTLTFGHVWLSERVNNRTCVSFFEMLLPTRNTYNRSVFVWAIRCYRVPKIKFTDLKERYWMRYYYSTDGFLTTSLGNYRRYCFDQIVVRWQWKAK